MTEFRSTVATWPIPLRERWGRLANDLAETGYAWPSDEAEAFRRVSAEASGQPLEPTSMAVQQAPPDAEPEPPGDTSWRWVVANWEPTRWTAWRARVTELLAPGAKLAEIQAAEWRAYRESCAADP